jgi:hypothetical protein
MNSFTSYRPSNNRNPECEDLLRAAEQELSAFFKAVTEVFGSEQAEISAEDWLHELEASHGLPASPREWRFLTASVSRRLASRLNAASLIST